MALLCNLPGKYANELSKELEKKAEENPIYNYIKNPYVIQHSIDHLIDMDRQLDPSLQKGYSMDTEKTIPKEDILKELETVVKNTETIMPVYSYDSETKLATGKDESDREFDIYKTDKNGKQIPNKNGILNLGDGKRYVIKDPYHLETATSLNEEFREKMSNEMDDLYNQMLKRKESGKRIDNIWMDKKLYDAMKRFNLRDSDGESILDKWKSLYDKSETMKAADMESTDQSAVNEFLSNSDSLRAKISAKGIQSMSKSMAFAFKSLIESKIDDYERAKNPIYKTPQDIVHQYGVNRLYQALKASYIYFYNNDEARRSRATAIVASRMQDIGLHVGPDGELDTSDWTNEEMADTERISALRDSIRNQINETDKMLKRNFGIMSTDTYFDVLKERSFVHLKDLMNLTLKSGIFSEEQDRQIDLVMEQNEKADLISEETRERISLLDETSPTYQSDRDQIEEDAEFEINEAMANSTYADTFYFEKDAKSFAPLTRKLLKSMPKIIKTESGRYTIARDEFGNVEYINPGAIQATMYTLIRKAENVNDMIHIMEKEKDRLPFLYSILDKINEEAQKHNGRNDIAGTLFINFHKSNTRMTKLEMRDGKMRRVDLTESEGYSYLFDRWRKEIKEKGNTGLFSNNLSNVAESARNLGVVINRLNGLIGHKTKTGQSIGLYNIVDRLTNSILQSHTQNADFENKVRQTIWNTIFDQAHLSHNLNEKLGEIYKEMNSDEYNDTAFSTDIHEALDVLDSSVITQIADIKSETKKAFELIGISATDDQIEQILGGHRTMTFDDVNTEEKYLKKISNAQYINDQLKFIRQSAENSVKENKLHEGWDRDSFEVIENDMISLCKNSYRNIAKMFREVDDSATEAFCRNGKKTYNVHQNKGYLDEFIDHVRSEMDRYDMTNERFKKWFKDEFDYNQFTYDDPNHPNEKRYYLEILNDLANDHDPNGVGMHFDSLHLLDYDGVEYANMKSPHVFASIYNQYVQSPSNDYAYYPVPVEADANSFDFIQMKKHNWIDNNGTLSDDCIEKFSDIVRQEYNRIKMVEDLSNTDEIDNFSSKGKQFCFMPELNDYTVNVVDGKQNKVVSFLDFMKENESNPNIVSQGIKKAITTILKDNIEKELDEAINMGAFNEDENNKGLYIIGSSISKAKSAIRDLFTEKTDEKGNSQQAPLFNIEGVEGSKFSHGVNKNVIHKELGWDIENKLKNGNRLNDDEIEKLNTFILKHNISTTGLSDSDINTLKMHTKNMDWENFQKAMLDQWYAQIEITQMLTTDVAFYKNYSDFIKRFKEVHSPHSKLDEDAVFVSNTNPEWRCQGKAEERVIYAKSIDDTPSEIFLQDGKGKDGKCIFDSVEDEEIDKQLSIMRKTHEDQLAAFEKTSPNDGQRERYKAVLDNEEKSYEMKLRNEKAAIRKMYEQIDWTDGAARRTLSSYRTILTMAHQWTEEQELVYQKLMIAKESDSKKQEFYKKYGELTAQDLQVFNRQTKFYLYGQVPMTVTGTSHTSYKIKVPVQHKDSETVFAAALREFAGKYDAKYIALNNWMDKNGVDAMLYDSCVKVGCNHTMDIHHIKEPTDADFKESGADGNLNKKIAYYEQQFTEALNQDANIVHTVPLKYFGDQTSTGDHLTGNETRAMGTQLMRMAQNDINPDELITVKGKKKPMTGKDLINRYNYVISKITQQNASRSMARMSNTKKLSHQLIRQTEGSEMYSIDDLALCATDANGNLNVPLYESSQIKRAFPLLTSIMKHNVEVTTMGGSALNACGDMLRKEVLPNFVFDKSGTRIQHIECLMPMNVTSDMIKLMKKNEFGLFEYDIEKVAKMMFGENFVDSKETEKEFAYTDEEKEKINNAPKDKQESIIKKIQSKNQNEIKKLKADRAWQLKKAQAKIDDMTTIIGYRIPSENKYSLWPMKITGFFDKAEYGNSIICPKEFTSITGADHDGDKMFFMQKNISLKPEKRFMGPNKVYERKPETFDKYYGAEDELFDLTYAMLTSQSAVQDFVNPQQFIQHEKMGIFTSLMKNKSLNEIYDAVYDHAHTDALEAMVKIKEAYDRNDIYAMFANIPLDVLKDVRKDIMHDDSPYLMSQYISQQQSNAAGKMDIGIGATNSNLHALMSGTNFKILSKEDIDAMAQSSDPATRKLGKLKQKMGYGNGFQFILNGHQANGFGEQRCFSGEKISRTTSATLGASVDTAKNATLPFVNINSATMNVANMLMDLGYNTEEVDAFLSQPVIVDMAKAIMSTDETKGKKSQINDAINKYQQRLQNVYVSGDDGRKGYENLIIKTGNKSSSGVPMNKRQLLISDLFKCIGGEKNFPDSNKDDFYITQVVSANLFKHLLEMSDSLQRVANSLKKDTKGGNNNPTVGRLLDKVINDKDSLTNMDQPEFQFSDDLKKFIDCSDMDNMKDPTNPDDRAKFEAIIQSIREKNPEKAAYMTQARAGLYTELYVLKKQFPFLNDKFIDMLKEIKEANGGHLSADQIDKVISHAKYAALTMAGKSGNAYLVTPVMRDGRAVPQRQYYIEDYPSIFNDALAKYRRESKKNITKHNLLLDNLRVTDTNADVLRMKDDFHVNHLKQKSIILTTASKKSKEFKEQIKAAWDELYHSQDKEMRDLAEALFKYNIHRYGMENTNGSLTPCVPSDMILSRSYTDSVRNIERMVNDDNLMSVFKDQLFKNLLSDPNFTMSRYINDPDCRKYLLPDNAEFASESFTVDPIMKEVKPGVRTLQNQKEIKSPDWNFVDHVESMFVDGQTKKRDYQPHYVFKKIIAFKVNVSPDKNAPRYENVYYQLKDSKDLDAINFLTPTYERIDSLGNVDRIKEYDLSLHTDSNGISSYQDPSFRLGAHDYGSMKIYDYISSRKTQSELEADMFRKYQEAYEASVELADEAVVTKDFSENQPMCK